MSKEYIERGTVVAFLENMAASRYLIQCFENKEKFPAADVEPVRHGRWLDEDSFDAHYQPIYRCSECNKTVADNYISFHKYCLHCGARMDGEQQCQQKK